MQQAARMDAYLGQYEDRQRAHSQDQSQYANPADLYPQNHPIGFQGTDYQGYTADSQNGYSHNQYAQSQRPRCRSVSGATWGAAPTGMPHNAGSAGGSVVSAATPPLGVGGQYQSMHPSQNGQVTTFEDSCRAAQRTQSWQQDKNACRGHSTHGYSGE
jgi:hypothetical protein